jgi:opacity protein-like surface antigen
MVFSLNNSARTAAVSSALVALATASPSLAQEVEDFEPQGGVYVSVLAGVTSPSDNDFEGVQAPVAPSPGTNGAPANVAVEFDEEFYGAVAVGYRIPKRVFGLFQPSIELEFSRTSPDVSGGSFNGGSQTFGGDFDVNTYSINYQSDIRWSNGQRVIPFLGGGVGIADVRANARYFPNNGATAPTFAVTGDDTALSLHSNAGVTFVINDNFDLNTRVRYQRVSGLDFERRFIAGTNDAFNADVNGDYETVSVLAGVRYRF